MHKLIKFIAPLIIICLLPSVCLGQGKIKTKILLTPCSSLVFENYFGIETPVTEQKFKMRIETKYNDVPVEYVKITKTNGFKLSSGPEIEKNAAGLKTYVYTLTAPQKEGLYKIDFESRVGEKELITYDTDIKVVSSDPKQNWVRAAIWAGISAAILGIALIASGMNK